MNIRTGPAESGGRKGRDQPLPPATRVFVKRGDVCAARALPVSSPGRDLRYVVALGPDRVDLYADDRPAQARVPIREYFQLLRGSGVHAIGSLAQIAEYLR